MSSKPKQTTSTTNQKTKESSSPWPTAAPYFEDLYAKGADAVGAVNNKLFGGDWIAAPTDAQRSSVAQLLAAAPGLSAGAIPLTQMASRIASGEFLDPNNPLLQAGISATINPLQERVQRDLLPQITDAAMKGGAYGGTAQALREGNIIDDFTENAGDIGSKMTLDWITSRFGDIFQAPGLFQSANTLALAPGTVTGLAGEAERGLDQLIADNAIKKYENELQAPFFGLQDFANLLTTGGFKTGEGTTKGTTVTTGPEPDMATQILQGVLGGAGTLASLGQAFPATMGAIGGGSVMAPILSGLSFLSDRRYKEDIKKIGVADNGLSIYRYRLKDRADLGYMIGFMADEVEKLNPAAVTEHNGVKFVDYYTATETL